MAQINARVSDSAKIKAEKVLKDSGQSISGYFSSIVDYIADTGSLPFEIRYKPELITPDNVFSEAVHKFGRSLKKLTVLQEVVQPGAQNQMELCKEAMRDLEHAEIFLRENQLSIYSAPCQIEVIEIGQGETVNFAASRERFFSLTASLKASIRCLNFNSRPIYQADLDEMKEGLSEAESQLALLHAMISVDNSADVHPEFIVISALEMLRAARAIVAENGNAFTFGMWLGRMDASFRDAVECQERIGIARGDSLITDVITKLETLNEKINRWASQSYLAQDGRNAPFDTSIIDEAEQSVTQLRRKTSKAVGLYPSKP